MSLYRARPDGGVVWITGASKGIGRELALKLASKGYTVAATARDEEKLDALAAAVTGGTGRILSFPGDVTEQDAMLAAVRAIERSVGPIQLAVFNAGSYFPTRGERLDLNNIDKTFDINFFGVLNGLVPVAELMRSRGRGQIVIVGSASSFFGWPSASAYGASKAALNNMAEALRYDFDKMNIRLQIVNPGFVETPLTERTTFKMPFLMKADEAAGRIVAMIESGGFRSTFPRRFTWLLQLVGLLPHPIRFVVINRLTGWKTRPMAAGRKPRASE